MAKGKMHVKKGDTVVVLTGPSEGEKAMKGVRGQVLVALPQEGKVIVSGINIIKRHTRPGGNHPQGGIISREAPIGASKVQVICPKCDQGTRIAHGFIPDAKKPGGQRKVRLCKKCGASLDK